MAQQTGSGAPERQEPLRSAPARLRQGRPRLWPQSRAPSLRTLVANSWSRCEQLQAGRDPTTAPPLLLEGEALGSHRSQHPLATTLPVCEELLDQAARDCGSVFAVSDADGLLLWVGGDPATRSRAERMNFVEGALWSEAEAGTNAPGTALAVGAPLQILAREHFNETVRSWSCAAAPIRDPDSGQILGVVDLTGDDRIGDPYALALVRATASAVESELALRQRADDAAAREHFSRAPGAAAAALVSRSGRVLDARGRIDPGELAALARGEALALADRRRLVVEQVGTSGYQVIWFVAADRAPNRGGREPIRLSALGRDSAVLDIDGRTVRLSPRHSEIVMVLALAGKGLSAGELAARLSLEELSTATIRMDMSRLRSVLGDDLLGSRPYLLRRRLRSDLDVLRDLLAAGRVRDALALYPGPLLPGSQAPAVIEQRMHLEQQLRGAVLGSQDAAALREWVNASWGATDVPAWVTLARALPAGSPQRAAASLRATALRHESARTGPARAGHRAGPRVGSAKH